MMKRSGGRRCRKNFFRSANGAITIEFVVTFPLILAALAFSYEFGRLFIAHHTTVNNVRSAIRYLIRTDLSQQRQDEAEQIVLTGRPSGGTAPDFMTGASVTITPSQSTFTDTNFRVGGQTVRIEVTAQFQLFLFGFLGSNLTTIPITIVEDSRHYGD